MIVSEGGTDPTGGAPPRSRPDADPDAGDRHQTLDAIRGIAVMGILVANLPAFALPEAAYFSPRAWGGAAPADLTVWFATLVLVEGKMRGLFSFLFGASMLLVIDRAEAAGQSAAAVHFRRMATLFAIGCAHLYLIWWGDILAHYALVGCIAFLFARLPVRWLVIGGSMTLAASTIDAAFGLLAMLDSTARHTPAARESWAAFQAAFGVPAGDDLAREIAANRGSWWDGVVWRWQEAGDPIALLPVLGWQTLSAMLFGMAGYRSGFLTGAWPRRRYVWTAAIGIAVAWSGYAALGMATAAHGFDPRWVYLQSVLASEPLRVFGYTGYAALIVLLLRPEGWWSRRIGAVGRTAFTNYLGTSVLMALVFEGWGLGRFARWSRAELYWLAPIVWTIMLAWSQPWLRRFRYGPLEWAWRSAARLAWQPLRRHA